MGVRSGTIPVMMGNRVHATAQRLVAAAVAGMSSKGRADTPRRRFGLSACDSNSNDRGAGLRAGDAGFRRDACATPDGAARHPNIADQTVLKRIRPQPQGSRTRVVKLRAGNCIRTSASLAAVASW